MSEPLAFTAGTTTANVGHAIKVSKAVFIQTAATQAASFVVNDINGNPFIPSESIPTSLAANQSIVLDYAIPIVLPGGALAPAAGSAIPNFVVTVVGAGATLYLTHR